MNFREAAFGITSLAVVSIGWAWRKVDDSSSPSRFFGVWLLWMKIPIVGNSKKGGIYNESVSYSIQKYPLSLYSKGLGWVNAHHSRWYLHKEAQIKKSWTHDMYFQNTREPHLGILCLICILKLLLTISSARHTFRIQWYTVYSFAKQFNIHNKYKSHSQLPRWWILDTIFIWEPLIT